VAFIMSAWNHSVAVSSGCSTRLSSVVLSEWGTGAAMLPVSLGTALPPRVLQRQAGRLAVTLLLL
jgi:hypothetical protein